MRLYIEEMVRGKDTVIGTADDVTVLSDSPMLAVEDSTKRASHGLPSSPSDFPQKTITVGSTEMTGYLFVEAEQQPDGSYYSASTQMHNKFAIIDNKWVFTGTWNFTVTGLYGSDENMANGVLDGNQNHVVEVNSTEMAQIYRTEFNEMWGTNTLTPDLQISNFSSRKIDNTAHQVTVGGKNIEVYFSPGDNAVARMVNLIKTEADFKTYFTIFAWSSQELVDELKNKWEGSYEDQQGTLTGFDVKGVFDSSFWTQWWSASIEMTGQTVTGSVNNPNTRWANAAPVYKDAESRKLHSKTMIVDADTDSDPTVIVGSTNWSTNGEDINDENLLIIHDQAITNQFLQEFNARYSQAGGTITQ
jgi:phosphatidylserine/phosphatidylglycerophosphate/cardiolipin synthase-like enzyme